MTSPARDLPDEPRWIEAHGIAADPSGWWAELGAGFAVGHDGARLVVVAGAADPAATAALARARARHVVLVPLEREDVVAELRASGRSVERAVLHTLASPGPELEVELDGAMLLPPDTPLDHLSPALADELAAARAHPIWTAFVDGEPVSFAYAPWRSPRWFEVAVETVPAARQLGLATIVTTALIRAERAHGREPVWGADESNLASRRLASRLGFVPVDGIWVAPP